MRGFALAALFLGCGPVDHAEPEPFEGRTLEIHGPPHIQYLNFDGGFVREGNSSDARTNTSGIPDEDQEVPPYRGGPAGVAAIADRVADAYSPFNVVITTERPPIDLEYSMTIIGGNNRIYCPDGCGAVGVAPLDCADTNPYDVAFTFADHFDVSDYYSLAAVTLQESAHAYGLGHTSDYYDWMFPSVTGFSDRWATCSGPGVCGSPRDCPAHFGGGAGVDPVCTPEGACCPRVLDDSSCGGEHQDSFATLMSMLGPARAEPFLPVVTFVTPTDLATVAASFTVELDVTDRIDLDAFDPAGVVTVDLVVDGTVVESRDAAPWTFDVSGLAAAVHEIEAVAFDASDNEGSALVTVRVVRDAECESDADCGGAGVCAMGLCRPAPDAPVEDPRAPPPRAAGGCSTAGAGAPALALLVAALLVRRRRPG